jgi:hypothetical protein
MASNNGHLEVAKLLIERGANRRTFGATALHWAAFTGNLRGVKTLLEAGVNINGSDERLDTDHTPLYIATMQGRWEVFQTLIEAGAVVNPTEILESAIRGGNFKIVHYLLKTYFSDFSIGYGSLAGYSWTRTPEALSVEEQRDILDFGFPLAPQPDKDLFKWLSPIQQEVLNTQEDPGNKRLEAVLLTRKLEIENGKPHRISYQKELDQGLLLAAVQGKLQKVEFLLNHTSAQPFHALRYMEVVRWNILASLQQRLAFPNIYQNLVDAELRWKKLFFEVRPSSQKDWKYLSLLPLDLGSHILSKYFGDPKQLAYPGEDRLRVQSELNHRKTLETQDDQQIEKIVRKNKRQKN